MQIRTRVLLCALPLLEALAPRPAAGLTLNIDIWGTDWFANVPFAADGIAQTGELYLAKELDTPGIPSGGVGAPPVAEGYANDTGTFWAAATTGLVPYEAHVSVLWSETYVKNSNADTMAADIVGGDILLQFFGGMPGFDLRGRVEFAMWIVTKEGSERRVYHVAEVTRLEGEDFAFSEAGDLSPYTSYSTSSQGGSVDVTAQWFLDRVVLDITLDDLEIGEEFTMEYFAHVDVEGAGGETSSSAYFRDPVSMTGGITVIADGPTPVAVPEPGQWLLACVGALVLALAGRARPVATAHPAL